MKPLLILALSLPLAAAATALQDVPTTEPLEQHAWLQQLVGTWDVVAEATMEPDAEPWRMESREAVRSVGGLWIVAEGSAELGGEAFTSIMTLGYDPAQEAFVGTWIDSTQTRLWVYRGALDASGKVLTLEAEGPSFEDPARNSLYRDVIEVVDADRRLLRSSVQATDGSWTTFLRAEYRRQR